MMIENIITIDAISSDSDWFGVTYFEDKDNAVNSLKSFTLNGQYPSPIWK